LLCFPFTHRQSPPQHAAFTHAQSASAEQAETTLVVGAGVGVEAGVTEGVAVAAAEGAGVIVGTVLAVAFWPGCARQPADSSAPARNASAISARVSTQNHRRTKEPNPIPRRCLKWFFPAGRHCSGRAGLEALIYLTARPKRFPMAQKEQAKAVSTVAIIGGAGNFGSWYAKFFRQKGLRVMLTARHKERAERAAEEAGAEWTTESRMAAAQADVVIVSVPAQSVPAVVREIAPSVKPGALLVDFSSVKGEACAALDEFKGGKIELASVHPMHGPRVSGLRNIPVAFIPIKPGERYSWLKRVFSSEGADVVETTCAEHDRAIAVVQGLTHFVCIATARAVRGMSLTVDKLLAFSTPNHELLEACIARVVLQDPRLYAGLQVENPLNKDARDAFIKAAVDLAASADAGDVKALERKIGEAA